MKTFSNRYIFVFSSVMVIFIAALLSFIAMQLQPLQEKNIIIEKKSSILAAMNIESTKDNADKKFEEYIVNSFPVNHTGDKKKNVDAFDIKLEEELDKQPEKRLYPVFVGQTDENTKVYVFPLSGKGLWGPIYGYLALQSDMRTVYGVTFDHDDETPGLGSEITTDKFQDQFNGKKIVNQSNKFVGVQVMKGGAKASNINAVDALSGATITSNGVQDMIYTSLGYYQPFIKKIDHE